MNVATSEPKMTNPSGAPELPCLLEGFLLPNLYAIACPFYFGRSIVYSSIDGFWLHLWYLQISLVLISQKLSYTWFTMDEMVEVVVMKYRNTFLIHYLALGL